jgi:hypothetical protein
MTHFKKLFLTLSLFAMQSAFGMDPVTKKARTGDSEWTLVTEEQGLKPWENEFAIFERDAEPIPFFVRPYLHIEETTEKERLIYQMIDCKGFLDFTSCELGYDLDEPWQIRGLKIRGLTREEAHTVKLGREIDYADDEQPVPNEIRLRALMPSEQTRWIVDDHLKFPVPLLAMKKFRHSALDPLPKDVVRLICKLAISDAHRENPVLRSIE